MKKKEKILLLLLIIFLFLAPFVFAPRNKNTHRNNPARIKPDDNLVYFNRALSKTEEDPKGAILDFTKALSIDPKDANAYTNRGILKRLMKDNTGAISDFSRAIAINPCDTKAYLNRAIAKRSIKDIAGAALDLEKAKLLACRQRKTNAAAAGLIVVD